MLEVSGEQPLEKFHGNNSLRQGAGGEILITAVEVFVTKLAVDVQENRGRSGITSKL